MESILNQQQTIHNAICSGQSITTVLLYDVVLRWVGIQLHNYIFIEEILLCFAGWFSQWKRREMDNAQQYTNTQQYTATICYL